MSPIWHRENGGILIDQRKISLNFVEYFQIKTSNQSKYDLKELIITELWPLHARRMNYPIIISSILTRDDAII